MWGRKEKTQRFLAIGDGVICIRCGLGVMQGEAVFRYGADPFGFMFRPRMATGFYHQYESDCIERLKMRLDAIEKVRELT